MPTSAREVRSFEHLRGNWRVIHDAGTVTCPGVSGTIPAGNPQVIHIEPAQGGELLDLTAADDSGSLNLIYRDSGPGGSEWFGAGEFGGVVIGFEAFFTELEGPYMHGTITSTGDGCDVVRSYSARQIP